MKLPRRSLWKWLLLVSALSGGMVAAVSCGPKQAYCPNTGDGGVCPIAGDQGGGQGGASPGGGLCPDGGHPTGTADGSIQCL
jgi:hypothetical protein